MPLPPPVKPANRVVVHGNLRSIGDNRHVLRTGALRQRFIEQRSRHPIGLRDRVRRIARVAACCDVPVAQDRIPPEKTIWEAQQAFRNGIHQTIWYQCHAEERRDRHAAVDFEMLPDPRGKQSAQRKTGNGYAVAQLSRDRDVLDYRSVEILGAQAFERGRQPVGMPVSRQARHDDVVAAFVKVGGDAFELRRTRA